jgi:NDP-sugar pyrophosphorylase family protein
LSNLNTIAILCGGLAKRLSPLTNDIPKSMIDINGKPFIYWQLEKLKKSGFDRVVLCVGHLSDQIINYVGNGRKWNLYVSYSIEKELFGTGGCIKRALPILDDFFFAQYGDSFLNLDYKNLQKKYIDSFKDGLMTVYENNDFYDNSNVLFDGNDIIDYNKDKPSSRMKHIDYGVGIFAQKSFDGLYGKFDLSDVYKNLLKRNQLSGYKVRNRFFEVGSLQGIEGLKKYLKGEK